MTTETKNLALAAHFAGLAQFYPPDRADLLRKAAADLQKGKSRKTVAKDLGKLRSAVNDPTSTVHRATDGYLSHFGVGG